MDASSSSTEYFNNIVNGLNFSIALSAFILFPFYLKYRLPKMRVYPKNLQLFLLINCVLCAAMISLCSTMVSIFYFIYQGHQEQQAYAVSHFLQSFFTQVLRLSWLMMVFERLVATICLERYAKYSADFKVFIVMTASSFFLASLYIIANFILMNVIDNGSLNFYSTYVVLFIHLLTLIGCKILHNENQKMYKMLAYRVSLGKRCQIVENIKVLNILWPSVIIYSIVGPIGPTITLFYNLISGQFAPLGLFYWSYNIAFLLTMVSNLTNFFRKKHIMPDTSLSIISPFGANLPKKVTFDNYFENLKNQWK